MFTVDIGDKNVFSFSFIFRESRVCLVDLQQDCPNGRLTPAKFVDMYKMFFPSGNAVEFCDHVFRTFDMDKNGYIDFKVTFCRYSGTKITMRLALPCEYLVRV